MKLLGQNVSRALNGKAAEFFIDNEEVYCIHNGNIYSFPEIPLGLLLIVEKELKRNIKAIRILESFGIKDRNEQLRFFIAARNGTLCMISPDIDENGVMQDPEYLITDNEPLSYLNKALCEGFTLKHGKLTAREMEVLKLIGAGLLDKEICAELGISKETLRHHKDSLYRKAGRERKASLAILAYQLNMVELKTA